MYDLIVRQFEKTLGNLDAILAKAMENAEARGFPVDNFMGARLAPDMLPFWRQITVACDVAKFISASLSGHPAPRFEDDEKTIADLRARIAKTLEFLGTVRASDFASITAEKRVPIPYPPGKEMLASEALVTRAVPNFYFHVSMAYALLRAGGVPIGKSDYLGQLHTFDA